MAGRSGTMLYVPPCLRGCSRPRKGAAGVGASELARRESLRRRRSCRRLECPPRPPHTGPRSGSSYISSRLTLCPPWCVHLCLPGCPGGARLLERPHSRPNPHHADAPGRSPAHPHALPALCTQSNTLRPYLNTVRSTLTAALTLEPFPSQVVERHNVPEIEAGSVSLPPEELASTQDLYCSCETAR